jgi:hypothetical protein
MGKYPAFGFGASSGRFQTIGCFTMSRLESLQRTKAMTFVFSRET